jgi:hypothetical protein
LNAQQEYDGLEIHYDPCTGVCSSTNTNYGNTVNMNAPNYYYYYYSDFGPRDLSDDWHGGVDFNSGAGNAGFGDVMLSNEA